MGVRERTGTRKERIERVVSQRQRDIVVVLENLHDPHNAAAIMRSCEAMGVGEIYLIFENQEVWNPRQVGKLSSSSANKWLDFKTFDSTAECIESLKKDNYSLWVTMVSDEAQDIFETDFLATERIALVVGNERQGVSDQFKSAADQALYIPMRGFVESLNVSVAAATCLFEITRQRQKSKENFSLSPVYQSDLVKNLLER
jgi:tRNA (guanosine-2'-O-)-methyltransferase